jgi:hypothetical protein
MPTMSIGYLQEHDASHASDAAELHGKSAGKRNLTDSLAKQDGGDAGSARALQSPAAPETPDAFDFSYVRPMAATDQAVEGEVQHHIDAGERNVNIITDLVFYKVHPELHGKKLKAGSPDAQNWLWIRDTFVVPAVRAAPSMIGAREAAHGQTEAKPHAQPQPVAQPQPQPVAQPQPQQAAPQQPAPQQTQGDHEQSHAGGGMADNVYRTQNDNLYMAGGTCNMTSLTMALLSFADGDETKVKHGAGIALKSLGKPLGGITLPSKKKVDLLQAIDTPDLLAQIQIEDLLTTFANMKGWNVTHGDVILKVAKATKLVSGGDVSAFKHNLKDAKGRKHAADMLAQGGQVILGVQGGPGHYVFLRQVLDDGVVVHDPAGCRCQYDAPFFVSSMQASEWSLRGAMGRLGTPGWPDAARRRLSHNPAMLAIVERLIAARGEDRKQQAATLKELATGEWLAMGESNFYNIADMARYQMDIRVEMTA